MAPPVHSCRDQATRPPDLERIRTRPGFEPDVHLRRQDLPPASKRSRNKKPRACISPAEKKDYETSLRDAQGLRREAGRRLECISRVRGGVGGATRIRPPTAEWCSLRCGIDRVGRLSGCGGTKQYALQESYWPYCKACRAAGSRQAPRSAYPPGIPAPRGHAASRLGQARA